MIGRGTGFEGGARRRPSSMARPAPRRDAAWHAVVERAVGLLYGEDVDVDDHGMQGMDMAMSEERRNALRAVISWFPGPRVGGEVVVLAAIDAGGMPVRHAVLVRADVAAWMAGRRGQSMALARQCGATQDQVVFVGAEGGIEVAIAERGREG